MSDNSVVHSLIATNKELRDVSFILRNMFKTGFLSAAQILYEAGNMDRRFRAEFHAASKQVSHHGLSFCDAVSKIFPARELSALRAGEESGKLYEVFNQIWLTAKVQEEINKVMKGLKGPVALIFIGIIISLTFFLTLVPSMVENMAGTVKDFEPSWVVRSAIASQHWLLLNYHIALGLILVMAFVLTATLSKRANREAITDFVIRQLIKIEPVGIAYSSLKFGFVAKYLEIVSLAGLEMHVRMSLVTDLLPLPLQPAMFKFRNEFENKGLKDAARSEGRPDDDPRSSVILWPPYFRLAIFQAHESGIMEESMGEYSQVLITDGKERLEQQIVVLMNIAKIVVGILVLIPVGLLYGTMGEILMLRMNQL